ncbi:hypothetical protein [uncultured Gimesia sp.]|uniref:hypothetical protein n=1 Tax=uncultured Gimesia sp. TaxID=1678688 RepID=UPI00262DC6E4|nr:hypothetical protein [uncultured Gimesia sp.]
MLPVSPCLKSAFAGVRGAGFCFLIVCAISIFVGCGGSQADTKPMGAVSGTINLADKPLTDCRINFNSSKTGIGAGGDLKEDGSYTLDGMIPVGEYTVFITPPLDFSPANAQQQSGLSSLPAKYRGESSSGLTADVKEGEGKYDFDLK